MKGKKILIVDDEQDIVELLTYNFKKQDMIVYSANSGSEAISLAKEKLPDVILLDVMLPDIDGMEVCEEIRKDKSLQNSLVLFLSARGEDYSQIAGYKVGADDYIVKPVKLKILTEKVRAMIERRVEDTVRNLKKSTSVILDPVKYTVTKGGEESIIPKKEFELMALLMSNSEKVFRREEILNKIWGLKTIVGDRTIDVHIRKLREKFGQNIIKTVKGIGYKFEDN